MEDRIGWSCAFLRDLSMALGKQATASEIQERGISKYHASV
jgi:hypothetical protein